MKSDYEISTPPDLTSSLPYQELGGLGFERLCYELLVEQGKIPFFFGRSGQKDNEADIVVENGDSRTIYQCKNRKDSANIHYIKKTVKKFELEWVNKAGLPKPTSYIYCCTQPLPDVESDKEWIQFSEDFEKRTGIDLQRQGREYFDARLRNLPDIVAGLFTDTHAELFCQSREWPNDPWVRICYGTPRHLEVERFLDRHQNGLVFVVKEIEDWFSAAASHAQTIMICGVPGSGKTTVGLELISRLRSPVRRIYYRTMKDGFDVERMQHSIRRRGTLPSFFVLDDCHLDLKSVATLVERLKPELQTDDRKIAILLLARKVSLDKDEDIGISEFEERLRTEDLYRDFRTGPKVTRRVLEYIRPDLIGLSDSRLNRLNDLTGGDLLLLDEVLQTISSPQDIDSLDVKKIFKSARKQYFGQDKSLPTIRRLASLAQFDLTPLSSYFENDWNDDEKVQVRPLIAEIFGPPRYKFLHSSLAALIFRSLSELEIGDNYQGAIKFVSEELVNYFTTFDYGISESSYTDRLAVEE
ncbi:hypothetical protein ACFL6A_04770, partial [bacterium]